MNTLPINKDITFPVFLNPKRLSVLITGNGKNVYAKLKFIVNELKTAHIKVILTERSQEIEELASSYPFVNVIVKIPVAADFENIHLAFFTDDMDNPERLKNMAAAQAVLTHFTFYPELNDFQEILPAQPDKPFTKNVSVLNRLAKEFSRKEYADPYEQLENTSRIVKTAKLKSAIYLSVIGIMVLAGLLGILIYEYNLTAQVQDFLARDNYIFYWMLLVGFVAEMIAGSMGMGYGVICTTILLILNVPPPVVSASIHSAESFTSAAGSISHYKLGNVNMKLVKRMALFAIAGAIIGSLSLTYLGEHYAHIVKPLIACYTLYIGINILKKSLYKNKEKTTNRKKSNLTVLGVTGGFIDSFAGGGWGPLVTGSLIKDGRTPRYVIGSSTLTKFLLTVTSAVTFIYTIGIHHWNIVLGLLIGGIITAPFSAMLTAKLPVKKMTIFISILVIVMSCITIVKSLLR